MEAATAAKIFEEIAEAVSGQTTDYKWRWIPNGDNSGIDRYRDVRLYLSIAEERYGSYHGFKRGSDSAHLKRHETTGCSIRPRPRRPHHKSLFLLGGHRHPRELPRPRLHEPPSHFHGTRCRLPLSVITWTSRTLVTSTWVRFSM